MVLSSTNNSIRVKVCFMAARESGTVKWFNNARGYGFITRGGEASENEEGNSDDIFVHYRNIRGDGYKSLNEGQRVEFELQEGEKGLQAEDVDCV